MKIVIGPIDTPSILTYAILFKADGYPKKFAIIFALIQTLPWYSISRAGSIS
jgi:hypothetical protein